jgi:hypothetical protein
MNEYRNIYCYYIYSPSNNYGSKPNFVHRDSLPDQGYRSLYAVTATDAEAIERAGTVAGWRGTVWEERLWIDVDSYEEAERLELKLIKEGYAYEAWDSGGKGAHFGIVRNCEPSHLLCVRDKLWVSSFGVGADTSIYSPLHLFRLGGSRHEKTGRPKELVSRSAGKAIELPIYEKPKTSIAYSYQAGDRSVFDCTRIRNNSVPVPFGQRHAHLVRLAYALRDDANVSDDQARWWLGEVNKLYEERKTEEELDHIIQTIYSKIT